MVGSVLSRYVRASAMGTMVLRAGIVALNFAVMIGLAAVMGLGAFGALAVVWGLALVAGTALSMGAPLLLLRRLTDGQGLSRTAFVVQVLALPLVFAVLACVVLTPLVPTVDWIAVVSAGFLINLITCLASIMRALGSVQASMALRDAGPQLALGIAGLTMPAAAASAILIQTAIWLCVIGALAAVWCLRHRRSATFFKRDAAPAGIAWSLWGTALLGMVLAQVDIVVGGSFLSAEQIGLYAVLRRIANLVALPVSVATWVSAGAVSAAFGSGDSAALRAASARGSRIALLPGLALMFLALGALPFLDLVIGQSAGPVGRWTFVVLVGGAFIQVVFASGFTVATLCGLAHLAAASRGLSILFYLAGIWALTPVMPGLLINGLIYVAAISLGVVLLCFLIGQRLDVDTSAKALWRRQEGEWKLS